VVAQCGAHFDHGAALLLLLLLLLLLQMHCPGHQQGLQA
jgi:hypothetical protein